LDGKQNGFGHYHQMTIKTILATIRFNCRLSMEIEKEGNLTNIFCSFWSPTRMGDLRKYGCHPTITISQLVTEVFQLLEKGGMPHIFENLSMTTSLNYNFEFFLLL